MLKRSYNGIVERNVEWEGAFATEPYECGWASEAIFFVRSLEGNGEGTKAKVEITPDGMHWCDEGTTFNLPAEGETTFCKVSHFGNWLKISGVAASKIKVLVTISLKE